MKWSSETKREAWKTISEQVEVLVNKVVRRAEVDVEVGAACLDEDELVCKEEGDRNTEVEVDADLEVDVKRTV